MWRKRSRSASVCWPEVWLSFTHIAVENDFGQGLVLDALAQHHAHAEGTLWVFIAATELCEDFGLGARHIVDRGQPRRDFPAQQLVENLYHIFLALVEGFDGRRGKVKFQRRAGGMGG